MMTLTMPDITGKTTQQQVEQIKNYLYQLVGYLQVNQGANNPSVTAFTVPAPLAQGSQGEVTEESWNTIKSLIIKSAQIVEAVSEKVGVDLEGKYVAQSDFGTYTQETSTKLEATDKAVEQLYTNVQTLDTQTRQLIETTAYIRSGLLGDAEDGAPIYGIEVGQKNEVDGTETFNAYARFTADRLSFYDSLGNELAWISGYKLYITHVEITGSMVGGGYEVDFSDGWAFKWVGG